MSANAREGGNDGTQVHGGPSQPGLFIDHLQRFGRSSYIVRIRHVLGAGAQQGIAMNRRTHQYTLAHLSGALEHGMFKQEGQLVIQQIILPLAGDDIQLLFGQLIMQFGGMYARAVHNQLSFEHALIGGQPEAVFRLLDFFHPGIHTELRAVHRRVIRQGAGQLIRAGKAAHGFQQSADNLGIGIGLQPKDFLPFNDPLRLDAIFHPLLVQGFDGLAFFLAESKHHGSGTAVGRVHLCAQRRVHLSPFHVQSGLQGAWLCVEARVNDTAVRLACAVGNILAAFQHSHLGFVAGQQPCDRAAYHAAANEDDLLVQNKPSNFCFARWNTLCKFCVTIIPRNIQKRQTERLIIF